MGARLRLAFALIGLAAAPLALGGCAFGIVKSVHQYSIEESIEVPAGAKARPIDSEATQHVVFGTTDTRFADEAYEGLLERCPHGRVINISARHSTRLGLFAYDNILKLHGTCLE